MIGMRVMNSVFQYIVQIQRCHMGKVCFYIFDMAYRQRNSTTAEHLSPNTAKATTFWNKLQGCIVSVNITALFMGLPHVDLKIEEK